MKISTAYEIKLVEGALLLHIVNTIHPNGDAQPEEEETQEITCRLKLRQAFGFALVLLTKIEELAVADKPPDLDDMFAVLLGGGGDKEGPGELGGGPSVH